MRKLLMAIAVIIFIAISFTGVGYAAKDDFRVDTETHINLLGKDRFAVDLQAHELVFTNEPLSVEYEEIWLEVRKGIISYNTSDTILRVVYTRGQGDGAKIDLKGLEDGIYSLCVGQIFYGYLTEDYEGDDHYEDEEDGDDEDYDTEENKLTAFPTYTYYDFNIVIEGGKSSLKLPEAFAENVKIAARERIDEYALDFYKNKIKLDYFKETGIYKQANSIIEGITEDYEKVKAIQSWVYYNIDYDNAAAYGSAGLRYLSAADVLKGKITVCEGFANLTVALMQAAGFPAKKIIGEASGPAIRRNNDGGHAWTQVYVDNRWVFMDSTWGDDYFDLPMVEYSQDHKRDDHGVYDKDYDIDNGSLYFYDFRNDIMLKEIKDFPFNGVVNSTYGFDIKDLYFDTDFKEPFKLGEMKVDSQTGVIYVDYCRGKEPYTVHFSIMEYDNYLLDYEGIYYNYVGSDYRSKLSYTDSVSDSGSGTSWFYFTPANAKLKKPIDPVRKGYTFLGWYNSDTGKKWNFATDKVTSKYDGMHLVTRWKKVKSDKVYYKVTFQHNNGVSPKSVSSEAGSKLTKPEDPSPRTNYKFVGWYSDSKCTKKWDFAKNKVTENVELFAGWKKK